MDTELHYELAREILDLLKRQDRKLVCAESCTAGLVAATLAGVPGASKQLCGSAVVYRNEAKIQWLGVSREILDDPAYGDVCSETAIQMARGALLNTSVAAVAASVTGHLGPGAPNGLDGVVYVGWAERNTENESEIRTQAQLIQLSEPPPINLFDISQRVARQKEATRMVLLMIRNALLS